MVDAATTGTTQGVGAETVGCTADGTLVIGVGEFLN